MMGGVNLQALSVRAATGVSTPARTQLPKNLENLTRHLPLAGLVSERRAAARSFDLAILQMRMLTSANRQWPTKHWRSSWSSSAP